MSLLPKRVTDLPATDSYQLGDVLFVIRNGQFFRLTELPQGPPGPPGEDGAPGNPVEFQASATHLQYRELGAADWIDLILIADLEGPEGPEGPAGPEGPEGIQIAYSSITQPINFTNPTEKILVVQQSLEDQIIEFSNQPISEGFYLEIYNFTNTTKLRFYPQYSGDVRVNLILDGIGSSFTFLDDTIPGEQYLEVTFTFSVGRWIRVIKIPEFNDFKIVSDSQTASVEGGPEPSIQPSASPFPSGSPYASY